MCAGPIAPERVRQRGPHQLISKLLFIASLDTFKEPLNKAAQEVLRVLFRFSSPRFPCFLSLLLRSQTQGASLCSFAPGPQKPLGSPDYVYKSNEIKVRFAARTTEPLTVEVGVLQGSALSSFFISILMNDLTEEVRKDAPWQILFGYDVVVSANNDARKSSIEKEMPASKMKVVWTCEEKRRRQYFWIVLDVVVVSKKTCLELEQLRRWLKIRRLGGERFTWQRPHHQWDKLREEEEEDEEEEEEEDEEEEEEEKVEEEEKKNKKKRRRRRR